MGCCLVALASTLGPRVVLAFLWLFSDRLTIAFESGWIGILGFLFLPWTALAYAAAYAPLIGVSGIGYVVVGLGIVFDISSYTSGDRSRRRRYANT